MSKKKHFFLKSGTMSFDDLKNPKCIIKKGNCKYIGKNSRAKLVALKESTFVVITY